MVAKWVSVQEIRLGAIYRFGHKRGLSREAVAGMLVERLGFTSPHAAQLVAHWFTTSPYRAV